MYWGRERKRRAEFKEKHVYPRRVVVIAVDAEYRQGDVDVGVFVVDRLGDWKVDGLRSIESAIHPLPLKT